MPILAAKSLLAFGVVATTSLAAITSTSAPAVNAPDEASALIAISPRDFNYRPAGDFSRNGVPVDAPMTTRRLDKPLSIMKTQVSAAAYAECVKARACRPLTETGAARADHPVVGVSWEDAAAYARWRSNKTGEIWRLPTDEEWAFAAGSRFADDAVGAGADFSQRWLAKYEQAAAQERAADRKTQPFGAFGANEHGLLDLSGNVWEWTNSCFVRQELGVDGRFIGQPFANCGVRLAEGKHRAFISNFVRDARGGGCAVGAPPTNLGFRLVREDQPRPQGLIARLTQRLRAIF